MKRAQVNERVRNGALLLDKKAPSWFRKTRITKLQTTRATLSRDGCGCVLAQTYGNYHTGVHALNNGKFKLDFAQRYGFAVINGCSDTIEFALLDDAWKYEIRKRRGTVKT